MARRIPSTPFAPSPPFVPPSLRLSLRRSRPGSALRLAPPLSFVVGSPRPAAAGFFLGRAVRRVLVPSRLRQFRSLGLPRLARRPRKQPPSVRLSCALLPRALDCPLELAVALPRTAAASDAARTGAWAGQRTIFAVRFVVTVLPVARRDPGPPAAALCRREDGGDEGGEQAQGIGGALPRRARLPRSTSG
jgi:hypothetical protein